MKRTTETVMVRLCPECAKSYRGTGVRISVHKEGNPTKEDPRKAGICWSCNRKRTILPYDLTYNISR